MKKLAALLLFILACGEVDEYFDDEVLAAMVEWCGEGLQATANVDYQQALLRQLREDFRYQKSSDADRLFWKEYWQTREELMETMTMDGITNETYDVLIDIYEVLNDDGAFFFDNVCVLR